MSDSVIRLTVHGVGDLPPRDLEPGEDRVWLTVQQFDQLLDAVAGRDDVHLTFDDGNASDLEIALPRLVERGMTAEFFLCAGLLGQPGRLTVDGVTELANAGMGIGCHGWNHVDWRGLDDQQIARELERSRGALHRITGRSIDHVSIPYGSYDRRVLRQVKRAGLSRVFTSDGGRPSPHVWLQDRISLASDMDQVWLQRVLDDEPTYKQRLRAVAARSVKRSRGRPHHAGRPGSSAASRVELAAPAAPARPAPRIAAVVVTYNSADVLGGCLASLSAGSDGVDLAKVIVVDNASSDASVSIAEAFDDVPTRVIKTGVNGGYAAGVNAGIDAMDLDALDAILVLNPDCQLLPGSLATLAKALALPRCGIAVPKLINPDGSLQPSLRWEPSIRRTLAESLLGSTAGRLSIGELATEPSAYANAARWPWATGAAMLLSTAMTKDLGPWDESFLLYSEETDFALRAADSGWDLWYEPDAVISHRGGDQHVSPVLASLVVSNRVRLYRRRHAYPLGFVYYLVEVVGAGLRAALGRTEGKASLLALVRPSRRIRALGQPNVEP